MQLLRNTGIVKAGRCRRNFPGPLDRIARELN
jgi:hypothetical protein